MKIIDEATVHMKDRRIPHNKIEIAEKIKKYEYLLDFINNDKGAYIFIKKNKLEFMIDHLKRKQH